MNKRFAAILTTINAPYRRHISELELIRCLSGIEIPDRWVGQVWGFLGEVPVDDQIAFATYHGISAKKLQDAARRFSVRSGAHFPILDMNL